MDWISGVSRIATPHSGGDMLGGPSRVTWHRTAGGSFESNAQFLVQEGFEPNILWDPRTGQIGQFLPLNRSAYALKHNGCETNRWGDYNIQIEVVDNGENFVITDTPMRSWDVLRRALQECGIPEVWPLGPPSPIPGPRAGGDYRVWLNRGGHYGHCHVPGNDHIDPGYMDPIAMFGHPPVEEWNMDEATFKKWVAEVVDDRVHVLMRGVPGDPTHQYGLKQIKEAVEGLKK